MLPQPARHFVTAFSPPSTCARERNAGSPLPARAGDRTANLESPRARIRRLATKSKKREARSKRQEARGKKLQ